jgi:hypothetical protein
MLLVSSEKTYDVTLNLIVVATSEQDAREKFWQMVLEDRNYLGVDVTQW